MVATIENSAPCRVFDSNGLEWNYVVECDTETGRVVCLKRESDSFVIDYFKGEAVRETHYTAAPLTLIPDGRRHGRNN